MTSLWRLTSSPYCDLELQEVLADRVSGLKAAKIVFTCRESELFENSYVSGNAMCSSFTVDKNLYILPTTQSGELPFSLL